MKIGKIPDNVFSSDLRVEKEDIALIENNFNVPLFFFNYGSKMRYDKYKGIKIYGYLILKQIKKQGQTLINAIFDFYTIITLDYEIFRNGTSDVKKVYDRTYKKNILGIGNKFGILITIFAEMAEYWAFKENSGKSKEEVGYYPNIKIKYQLKEAVEIGHDVQLHLHPQWLIAQYRNGNWESNYQWWRTHNMPHGLETFDNILSIRGIKK